MTIRSITETRAITRGGPDGLVSVRSPVPREEWNSVLEGSPEATIFHTPEWIDACCEAGGLENVSRLYETADGARIVFPMVQRRAPRQMLRTIRSLPDGWGFGGAVGSRRVLREDVAMMLDDLEGSSARLIVKPGPLTGGAWLAAPARQRVPHVIHIVDLREGFGALWSHGFSSGTRNKIRKAEKRGVEVQWGSGSELVRVHWDIYLRWTIGRAKERGIPVSLGLALAKHRESLRRFEIVARHLGDRCQVWVASVDGQPAASTIVLSSGAYAHYWRSTSDQALAGPRYPNYLLLARQLEHAAEHGNEFFDMGESGGVSSLARFKEQFGAKPFPYEEVRFEPRIVTNAARVRDRLLQDASDLSLKSAALLKRMRTKIA
jgi:hypothetical protein